MSEDAKAILLLCGHFGGVSEFAPLDLREYNQVVLWLKSKNMRPAGLLSLDHGSALARETGIPELRLNALLKRGVQLGFAVEKWNQGGIWVVCRSDQDYPARYMKHLKEKAPPVLFGAGDRALLKGGGLAIVGSRNVDAEGEAFARDVAAWCAQDAMPVVSGGARGVDQIAMASALDAGGVVIGILADTLLRTSVSRECRHALSDGRLLLLSPYHPEAGFTVGNAMGRNKLVYAIADYGLVVSSDHKKGGTWAGAEEELKRKPGRPVFVRLTGSVPIGNRKLVELGARPFPPMTKGDLKEALEAIICQAPVETESDLPLFASKKGSTPEPAVREKAPVYPETPPTPALTPPSSSIYEAVLPIILTALEKPAVVAELAVRLEVSKAQLEAWLKRAVNEKKIRKLNRPVRYARGYG
jgi:predicted Rossmann fold nucleotide-binding protein DprA/Smf involved in DNA uptake